MNNQVRLWNNITSNCLCYKLANGRYQRGFLIYMFNYPLFPPRLTAEALVHYFVVNIPMLRNNIRYVTFSFQPESNEPGTPGYMHVNQIGTSIHFYKLFYCFC